MDPTKRPTFANVILRLEKIQEAGGYLKDNFENEQSSRKDHHRCTIM